QFDPMLAYAKRLTRRDESFCLDVVQDAMMRIVRNVQPMESRQHLRRWVRRIVRSVAIDHLRRESTRAKYEDAAEPGEPPPSVAESLHRAEQIEALQERLAKLKPDERGLVWGRIVEGLSFAELGKRLGIGPGGVHGRLKRLLRKLREGALL
ncbi:MAG: RNA polymerase sigma factor, partial [Planctomycetota bacterium]